jgi:hypothetical protein
MFVLLVTGKGHLLARLILKMAFSDKKYPRAQMVLLVEVTMIAVRKCYGILPVAKKLITIINGITWSEQFRMPQRFLLNTIFA